MPRPLLRRRIRFRPDVNYFKPAQARVGVEDIGLTLPELEAIRLRDLEGKTQAKCAKEMNVSQPTFSRIIESSHKKVASALVEGRGIKIEGGEYRMVRPRRGVGSGRGAGLASGRGRMGGTAAGPTGYCICPKCGYKKPHQLGTPCYLEVCPKCECKLVRE